MKDDAKLDRKAYQVAREFLLTLSKQGVTAEVVESYLNPDAITKPGSLEEIYKTILQAAQNANMKIGVIGRAIGGVDQLAPVLKGFSPGAVLKKYGSNWEAILDDIETMVKPKKKFPRTNRSLWPGYCRTILSAARFLEQFSTAEDFFKWVDFFDRDPRTRPALPLLMSKEIEGLGFALSCDVLIRMGYADFCKPDVHLRRIFTDLGLCKEKDDDYQLYKAVIRLANHAGVSPFNADKVFWLAGSGKFFKHPEIGKNEKLVNLEQRFIEHAKNKLGQS